MYIILVIMENLLKEFDEKVKLSENIKFEDMFDNKQIKEVKNKLNFIYHSELEVPDEERLKYLREQVKKLSQIPQPIQRSVEWHNMRSNMITASDWAAALGKNKYSPRVKLLRAKCGEKQSFFGGHMKHGVKYEPVANMIYEYRNKVKVIEFGLIPHPTISYLGASPDGITEDGIMLEIKCPPKREITGIPPEYYWIQVQGQLEVCGLDRCDFLECDIKEFDDEDDYFNDNYEGYEKGIILVFLDKSLSENNISYEYSSINITREEYELWEEEVKERLKSENKNKICIAVDFWYLNDVSCVPIYRDIKWFADNLPILDKFWKDVLHYREKGIDELIKPKREPRKTMYIETQIEDYMNNNNNNNNNNDISFKNECMFNLSGITLEKKNKEDNKTSPKLYKEIDTSKCLFRL